MTGFIYDYTYTALIALTALFCYCGFHNLEKAAPGMFIAILLPAAVLTLFIHMKARGKLMLAGVTLAAALGVFLTYRYASDTPVFSEYPWLLPLAALSLISFGSGLLTARMTIIKMAVSVSAVILLLLTLLSYIRPLDAGVFFAMLLVITSIADIIQLRWKKDGFTDHKIHMVYTLPFLVLIIILASLMPCPDKPYDWQIIKKAWHFMTAAADRLEFSFHPASDYITGFSDDGRLISGLTRSDTDVLSITADPDTYAPVYLTGTICDSFDGHRWIRTDDSSIPERTFDALESISSVRSYSENLRDYYRESKISISYLDTKTKYLFTPSKLSSKEDMSGSGSVYEQGGDLLFKKYNPYHFSIKESYLIPNTGNPGFYDFMQSDACVDELHWKETLSAFRIKDQNKAFSYEKYTEYKQHIQDLYSDNISLSDTVNSKVNEICGDTEDKYERLKRLEAFLQNMEYTLDPPSIPDSVGSPAEYLDYFLLESGRGYCSYFATAFVLLARSEGLPARYVQGYRVPIEKKGTYTVSSAMAHAWPEVYFDGKGWIAFEPTPGFLKESSWEMSNDAPSGSAPYIPAQQVSGNTSKDSSAETVAPEMTGTHRFRIYVLAAPSALILVFFILFLLINRLLQRRRFNLYDDAEKAAYFARDNLILLGLLGQKITPGETLDEYAKRIKADIDDEALTFIPYYETLLYSGKGGSKVGSEEFQRCHDRLLILLKKNRRMKYLLRLFL